MTRLCIVQPVLWPSLQSWLHCHCPSVLSVTTMAPGWRCSLRDCPLSGVCASPVDDGVMKLWSPSMKGAGDVLWSFPCIAQCCWGWVSHNTYWVTGTVSVGPDITMCNVNVMLRVLLLTPIVHYNVVTGQRKWRWCWHWSHDSSKWYSPGAGGQWTVCCHLSLHCTVEIQWQFTLQTLNTDTT